ncbi:sugar phosphate isomerase/epimerase [Roseiconus nitratireducens]|uniref:Sugar phosphate isomerase/epimerase n=1 Tax=Roseiconus nitratireducens TaxID=2605748 RepID=A0A5M6DIJ6_9BACT|nr:sugar phosphate isomerase/epimerase family protein [Roseiconus nitratireducens]KAA5547293.1 sugar phosphate isomerase/epimerase [Roseiconus nitratireducens]
MNQPSVLRRRTFLSGVAAAVSLSGTRSLCGQQADSGKFRISLAEWTINRELKSGEIDHLDFAKVASDHGIFAVEYVNQFFMDKARDQAYLAEMKKRADDLGVKSLILMCDHEGRIGDPNREQRNKTVENHRKWIDAAKYLGCHSIRVNAASEGPWDEQVRLAADGLSQLTEFGAQQQINVIVENHGGLSSNADWLAQVIERVAHERCGTLPDFGNFRIREGESYDSYRGVEKLMPWAKGVSVKDQVWDDQGNRMPLDFERMLKIVLAAGYHGYCGIEFGGYANLNASRLALEQARERL